MVHPPSYCHPQMMTRPAPQGLPPPCEPPPQPPPGRAAPQEATPVATERQLCPTSKNITYVK
jgi:hypothetical protein